jgi:cysteine desulfurase/selenocysteine lyase
VSPSTIDLGAIRAAFPGLDRKVHGRRLVYLDSAATAQRCSAALEAMDRYHREFNSNVHRGVYTTSEEATFEFEGARRAVAGLIAAPDSQDVVFTRGTTEAVNLVARSFLGPRLSAGDEILVTQMEHHSNLVPWQMVASEHGAKVVAAGIDAEGNLDLDDFRAKLGPATKMVALSHASNVLGTVNPVGEITAMAGERGIPVFVDGAQSAPHLPVDVTALGADFFAFSGHKLYGPTGSGALWGRKEHLAAMPPLFGGGDMIEEVRIESSTYARPPQRFEAGTPNVAAIIGLGAAIGWYRSLGQEAVASHEDALLERAKELLSKVEGLRILGDPRRQISVLCFEIDGLNAQDVATLLDQEGIAVRSGHHCAQPLMRVLGVTGCLRVSIAAYNSAEDLEALASGLAKVCRVLRG